MQSHGNISISYILLIEYDSIPDHNIKDLYNFLSMVDLFILGGLNRLVAISGCPGLSLSLLNIGQSNLVLKID